MNHSFHPFRVRQCLRAIALATVVAFSATTVMPTPSVYAQSPSSEILGGNRLSAPTGQVLDGKITVPPELGTIDEVYFAPDGGRRMADGDKPASAQSSILNPPSSKTIVFVQDAHDSLEAQENIAKLIEHLVATSGVRTVFEEGYEGPVPTDDYFGSIQDPELKRKVAFFFMDHLRIGGAEYAHINRNQDGGGRREEGVKTSMSPSAIRHPPSDFELIGADSLKLYRENVDQYRLSAERKASIEQDLKALEKELRTLVDTRFPKEFKEWLKLKEQFDAKELDLFTYLGRTMSRMRMEDGGLRMAENTKPAPSAIRPPSSKAYDSIPLLRFITEAVRTNDPVVVEKAKHIDAREVFDQLNQLEKSIVETWVPNATDRELYGYYRILSLLERLNELQITQEEYASVQASLKAFNTQALGAFVHQKVKKPLVLSKQWERNIREAVKFYEIAAERDGALSKALDKYFRMEGGRRMEDGVNPGFPPSALHPIPSVSVLVYGGFHKENIKRILEAKGISYIVVSPKITKPSPRHEAFYKKLMTEGSFPFERAILSATAVPAERVFVRSEGRSEILAVEKTALRYPDREGTWDRYLTEQKPAVKSPAMRSETRPAPGADLDQATEKSGAEAKVLPTPSSSSIDKKQDWKEGIPFYRFLKTADKRTAFGVIALGSLFLVMTLLLGGLSVWDLASRGFIGSSIYAALITAMTACMVFGMSEALLLAVLVFFSPPGAEEEPPAPVSDAELPEVTVQIPIRNEPPEVVLDTLRAAMAMDYPAGKLRIQIMDNTDTRDPRGRPIAQNRFEMLQRAVDAESFVRDFQEKHGEGSFSLLHREGTQGYKAGNLNIGLRSITSPYILQLDSDSMVKPDTLRTVMPEFVHHENDRKSGEPKLAFVQIALDVKNESENTVTRVLGQLHRIYELFLNRIRKHYRFVSSTGHHMILAREAITDAGGHPEDVGVGEDTDLAIGIQIIPDEAGHRKWMGKRIDYHRLGEMVPEDFDGLKVQRWRWAFGNTRVLVKRFFSILRSPLNWYEKFALFFDLSVFLQGSLIVLLSLAVPAVLSATILGPGGIAALFYPAAMSGLIMISWGGAYGLFYVIALKYLERDQEQDAVGTIKAFLGSTSLFSALIPTLMSGTFQGLFRKSTAFSITPKGASDRQPFFRTLGNNLSGVLLGVYLIAFTPLIPQQFGYTIPGLLIGLSAILWPFHRAMARGVQNWKERIRFWMDDLKDQGLGFVKDVPWSKVSLFILGGAIFLGAMYVRFHAIDDIGPWIDEGTYNNAGRDAFHPNPEHDWGWISGWKYAWPVVAAATSDLYGSFIGSRIATGIFGMGIIVFSYLFSRKVIPELMPGSDPSVNEKRSLAALFTMAFSLPLIFISRLATYDAMAYFFFAVSIYLIEKAAHTLTSRQGRWFVAGATAFFLAVVTKYVVVLFTPVLLAYTLMHIKDKKRWMLQFAVPLGVMLTAFVGLFGDEVIAGIKAVPKGWWVSRSLGGVLWETLVYLFPSIVLGTVGFFSIPKEKRPRAWWYVVGWAFMVGYYAYDRQIQGYSKVVSLPTAWAASLAGIGMVKLLSFKFHARTVVNFLGRCFFVGALFLGSQWPQRHKIHFWGDWYASSEVIQEVARAITATGKQELDIYTTRPQELILLVPGLEPYVNKAKDLLLAPAWIKPYINTIYSVDKYEMMEKMRNAEYDIVHLEADYWYYNPEDKSMARDLTEALRLGGYVEIYLDDKPRSTGLGESRDPLNSKVFVHRRHLPWVQGLAVLNKASTPTPLFEATIPLGRDAVARKDPEQLEHAFSRIMGIFESGLSVPLSELQWQRSFDPGLLRRFAKRPFQPAGTPVFQYKHVVLLEMQDWSLEKMLFKLFENASDAYGVTYEEPSVKVRGLRQDGNLVFEVSDARPAHFPFVEKTYASALSKSGAATLDMIRQLVADQGGSVETFRLSDGPDTFKVRMTIPATAFSRDLNLKPLPSIFENVASVVRSEMRPDESRSDRSRTGVTRRQMLWMAAFGGIAAGVAPALVGASARPKVRHPLENADFARVYKATASGLVKLRLHSLPVNQTSSPKFPDKVWIKPDDMGYMMIADLLMMIHSQEHPVDGLAKPELAMGRILDALKMMTRLTDDFELKVPVNGQERGTGLLPEYFMPRGDYFEPHPVKVAGLKDTEGIAYAFYNMGLTHERLKIIRDVFAGGIVEGIQNKEIHQLASALLARTNYRPFIDAQKRIHSQVFKLSGTGEVVQGPLVVDNQHTEARFILSIADLLGTPGKSEEERYQEGIESWNTMWFRWRSFKVDGREIPVAEGDHISSLWTEAYGAQFYDPREVAPKTWGRSFENYGIILDDLKKRHGLAWTPATGTGTARDPGIFSEFGIGNYPNLPSVIVPAYQFVSLASGSREAADDVARFVRAADKKGAFIPGWGLPDAVDPVSAEAFNRKMLFINQALTLEFLNYPTLRDIVRKTAWGQRAIRQSQIEDRARAAFSLRSESRALTPAEQQKAALEGLELITGGKKGQDYSSDDEVLAVMDASGRFLKKGLPKKEVHDRHLEHMTGHIYFFDPAGNPIFQKRSSHKSQSPGRLQVAVSGHINFGEMPVQGTLREGFEESGITIDPASGRFYQISEINQIYRPSANEHTTVYAYFVTPEEMKILRDNYNTEENELFCVMPFSVFEERLGKYPDAFSGSLHFFVEKHPELLTRLKDLARDRARFTPFTQVPSVRSEMRGEDEAWIREIALGAIRMAEYIHDSGFKAILASGDSADIPRELVDAAWERFYPNDALPAWFLFDGEENKGLYRDWAYARSDGNDSARAQSAFLKRAGKILNDKVSADGGTRLAALKDEKMAFLDSRASTGMKTSLLKQVFAEAGFPKVSYAVLTADDIETLLVLHPDLFVAVGEKQAAKDLRALDRSLSRGRKADPFMQTYSLEQVRRILDAMKEDIRTAELPSRSESRGEEEMRKVGRLKPSAQREIDARTFSVDIQGFPESMARLTELAEASERQEADAVAPEVVEDLSIDMPKVTFVKVLDKKTEIEQRSRFFRVEWMKSSEPTMGDIVKFLMANGLSQGGFQVLINGLLARRGLSAAHQESIYAQQRLKPNTHITIQPYSAETLPIPAHVPREDIATGEEDEREYFPEEVITKTNETVPEEIPAETPAKGEAAKPAAIVPESLSDQPSGEEMIQALQEVPDGPEADEVSIPLSGEKTRREIAEGMLTGNGLKAGDYCILRAHPAVNFATRAGGSMQRLRLAPKGKVPKESDHLFLMEEEPGIGLVLNIYPLSLKASPLGALDAPSYVSVGNGHSPKLLNLGAERAIRAYHAKPRDPELPSSPRAIRATIQELTQQVIFEYQHRKIIYEIPRSKFTQYREKYRSRFGEKGIDRQKAVIRVGNEPGRGQVTNLYLESEYLDFLEGRSTVLYPLTSYIGDRRVDLAEMDIQDYVEGKKREFSRVRAGQSISGKVKPLFFGTKDHENEAEKPNYLRGKIHKQRYRVLGWLRLSGKTLTLRTLTEAQPLLERLGNGAPVEIKLVEHPVYGVFLEARDLSSEQLLATYYRDRDLGGGIYPVRFGRLALIDHALGKNVPLENYRHHVAVRPRWYILLKEGGRSVRIMSVNDMIGKVPFFVPGPKIGSEQAVYLHDAEAYDKDPARVPDYILVRDPQAKTYIPIFRRSQFIKDAATEAYSLGYFRQQMQTFPEHRDLLLVALASWVDFLSDDESVRHRNLLILQELAQSLPSDKEALTYVALSVLRFRDYLGDYREDADFTSYTANEQKTAALVKEIRDAAQELAQVAEETLGAEEIRLRNGWRERFITILRTRVLAPTVRYADVDDQLNLPRGSYRKILSASTLPEDQVRLFADALKKELRKYAASGFGMTEADFDASEMFFHYIAMDPADFVKAYPAEAYRMLLYLPNSLYHRTKKSVIDQAKATDPLLNAFTPEQLFGEETPILNDLENILFRSQEILTGEVFAGPSLRIRAKCILDAFMEKYPDALRSYFDTPERIGLLEKNELGRWLLKHLKLASRIKSAPVEEKDLGREPENLDEVPPALGDEPSTRSEMRTIQEPVALLEDIRKEISRKIESAARRLEMEKAVTAGELKKMPKTPFEGKILAASVAQEIVRLAPDFELFTKVNGFYLEAVRTEFGQDANVLAIETADLEGFDDEEKYLTALRHFLARIDQTLVELSAARSDVPAPSTTRSESRERVNMTVKYSKAFHNVVEGMTPSARATLMDRIYSKLSAAQYSDDIRIGQFYTVGTAKRSGQEEKMSHYQKWKPVMDGGEDTRLVFRYVIRSDQPKTDPKRRDITFVHFLPKGEVERTKDLQKNVLGNDEALTELDPVKDAAKIRQLEKWLYGSPAEAAPIPEDFKLVRQNLPTHVFSYLQVITDLRQIVSFVEHNLKFSEGPGQPLLLQQAVKEMQAALAPKSSKGITDFAGAAKEWLKAKGAFSAEIVEEAKDFLNEWFGVEIHLLTIIIPSLRNGVVTDLQATVKGLAGLYFEIAGPDFRLKIRKKIEDWAMQQPRNRAGLYNLRMAMRLIRQMNKAYPDEEAFTSPVIEQWIKDIARDLRKAETEPAIVEAPAPVKVEIPAPAPRPVAPVPMAPVAPQQQFFKFPEMPELADAVGEVAELLKAQGLGAKAVENSAAVLAAVYDPSLAKNPKKDRIQSLLPGASKDKLNSIRLRAQEMGYPFAAGVIEPSSLAEHLSAILERATGAFRNGNLDKAEALAVLLASDPGAAVSAHAATAALFKQAENLRVKILGVRDWISALFDGSGQPEVLTSGNLSVLVNHWVYLSDIEREAIYNVLFTKENLAKLASAPQGPKGPFLGAFLLPFLWMKIEKNISKPKGQTYQVPIQKADFLLGLRELSAVGYDLARSESRFEANRTESGNATLRTEIRTGMSSKAQGKDAVRAFNAEGAHAFQLTEPMVFVVEQARIAEMKSKDQEVLLKWLLGFAKINQEMLRVVIPDMEKGVEPSWVSDLKQVTQVHRTLSGKALSPTMPVFYFSTPEAGPTREFIANLGKNFKARSATLVHVDDGKGFVLAALLGKQVDELPVDPWGFHRDIAGHYSSEIAKTVQAFFENYLVIASAA